MFMVSVIAGVMPTIKGRFFVDIEFRGRIVMMFHFEFLVIYALQVA